DWSSRSTEMAGMRLCRLARCQRSRRLLTAQAPAGSRSSSTPQKKSLRPGDEDVFVGDEQVTSADQSSTGVGLSQGPDAGALAASVNRTRSDGLRSLNVSRCSTMNQSSSA